MSSKYELTISTNYVHNWSYIEAIREIFQNAKDNEIINPENKMTFKYKDGILMISNRSSILNLDSLLLGVTSKAGDPRTIGSHGEGYKIAIMVLLREGKGITIYNKGNQEVWTTKLVKSKRFNGQMIPTVTVTKQGFFSKYTENDLTVEITGISEDEHQELVERILDLQDDFDYIEVPDEGRILISEQHAGKLFIKGLYVCSKDYLKFGYDFEPSVIRLDRDRKLISEIDINWESSYMLKYAYYKDYLKEEIEQLIMDESKEVEYLRSRDIRNGNTEVEKKLGNRLAEKFVDTYGNKAYPVSSNEEMDRIKSSGSNAEVKIVSQAVAELIKKSGSKAIAKVDVPKELTLKERFMQFADKVRDQLDDELMDELDLLIEEV